MKITTNILDIKIDYEKIDKDFVIVEFKTNSDKKPNPRVFDLEDINVYSISYTYGKCAYALMDEDSYNDLQQASLDETISYKKVDALYADRYKVLLRLLINYLANYNDDLAYNNLTGKLYKFDSKYRNSLKMIELGVDYDSKNDITTLKCSSCTFIKINKFNNKDIIYTLDGNRKTLRRCFNFNDNMYIKKGIADKRTSKVFLRLKDGDGRAKIMYDLLNDLNNEFSNYISISFKSYDILETKPAQGIKLQDVTFELINKYKLAIINLTKEEENIKQIEMLRENIEISLDRKVNVFNELQKKMFNIVIIHNKEYYDNLKIQDTHNLLSKEIVIQCVTIEEIRSMINKEDLYKMTPALVTVLKELLIKNDIINTNKFSYDDWSKYNYLNDWSFYRCDDDKKYLFEMIINKNGDYKINKVEINLFNNDQCIEFMRLFKENYNLELIIKDDIGNVNYIEKTDIISMPDESVFNSFPIRKDKETRNKLYPGLCNINYSEINNKSYYNIGQDSKNIKFEFVKASHFRKINVINESKNIVKELLDLMSVSFVKMNELTILPYPIKYLNEYIELNKKL